MEFFFDNPLANLPGPLFLMFYAMVIAFAIIAFQIFKRQFDTTRQLPLPPIAANPDAYEITFLRGGANELARSVVFALNQKGFLQVATDAKSKTAVVRQTATQPKKYELNSLEQKVYDWFAEVRATKNIFAKNGLASELSLFAETYEGRLRQHNLLTNAFAQSRVTKFKWLLFLGVAALGSYKLLAALAHQRYNIGFLELMTLATLIIFNALSGLPRVSALGKLYLEQLQLAFDRLKLQINRQPPTNTQTPLVRGATAFSAVDPLLLAVGVFGVGALAGTAYDNYHQAFYRSQQQTGAGSSSSCGSGCGSSWDPSSSSGSSGDSGGGGCGGSCGGGCGGCGG